MKFLLAIFINTGVLIITAKLLSKVHITGWGSAFGAALLIGIFNPTIGWILNLFFNVATLGLFAIFGLSFIIRLIVLAIIIKFVDWLMSGLKVEGFGTAIIIALVMAFAGTLLQILLI